MAFFDRLIGDPRQRRMLQERAQGQGTLAGQAYAQQRAANAGAANATQARLTDVGGNPALAGRIAARQEGAANAAAGQMFATQMTAERQRAEAQLADMRAQRQGFFRQMLGAGLRTGGAMLGTYIGGPVGGALGGQVGNAAAGAVGAAPAPGQGVNAGNFGNAPGGAGDGLGLVQVAPRPAEAAPAALMTPQQQAAGTNALTMSLVDQAIAGGPQGAVPTPEPGIVDTYGAGLTDDEYLQWLMAQRGGV